MSTNRIAVVGLFATQPIAGTEGSDRGHDFILQALAPIELAFILPCSCAEKSRSRDPTLRESAQNLTTGRTENALVWQSPQFDDLNAVDSEQRANYLFLSAHGSQALHRN
jgi:hypothetical protein